MSLKWTMNKKNKLDYNGEKIKIDIENHKFCNILKVSVNIFKKIILNLIFRQILRLMKGF